MQFYSLAHSPISHGESTIHAYFVAVSSWQRTTRTVCVWGAYWRDVECVGWERPPPPPPHNRPNPVFRVRVQMSYTCVVVLALYIPCAGLPEFHKFLLGASRSASLLAALSCFSIGATKHWASHAPPSRVMMIMMSYVWCAYILYYTIPCWSMLIGSSVWFNVHCGIAHTFTHARTQCLCSHTRMHIIFK